MPSAVAVTENTILPGLGLADLRPDLIGRARAPGPDAALSDEEFLLGTGLARRDASGEIGILLPALLLFGRDEALRGALPEHGTVARFRDGRGRVAREEIRTNLLDSFDRLMAFAARYLPEAPVSPGLPADLRDRVLAGIFVNSLLHRDYTKPFPARFGIEPGRVYLENGSVGPTPGRPKNPILSRLFTRMEWTGNGGGPSPLALWGRAYFGAEPLVFDGSIFRLVATYPKHGPAVMQAEPAKPAPRVFAKMRDAARVVSIASTFPALRSRPSVRDLESLLSEKLPALPVPLDLGAGPVAPVRPAFLAALGATTEKPAPAKRPPEHPHRATTADARAQATPASPVATASGSTTDREARILKFCETPRHRSEIQEFAGFQNRDYFRKEILNPLIERGLLAPTLPDKPNSPNQQYRAIGA